MARPKYNAVVPINTGSGNTYWHKVGAGWVNDKGQLSVTLNSYPLPNSDGQVKFYLFENTDNDSRQSSQSSDVLPPRQGRTLAEELDDEIPF